MISWVELSVPILTGSVALARGRVISASLLLFSAVCMSITFALSGGAAPTFAWGSTHWSAHQEPNGVSVLLPDNCKQYDHPMNFGFGFYPTHSWQTDNADGNSLLFQSIVLPADSVPDVHPTRDWLEKLLVKEHYSTKKNLLLLEGRGTLVTMEVASPGGKITHARIYQEDNHEYVLIETPRDGGTGKMMPSFHHF